MPFNGRMNTKNPYKEDVKSTAVLAGAGYLIASQIPNFLETFRESLYHARHAARTGKEILTGGPEGMKAVKNLEDALEIVEKASKENETAKGALESYFSARKDLVTAVASIYQENETLGREAERLEVQVKGFIKNFFELGNEIKPDVWKKYVDTTIIKLYGMDPVKAIEKSERLKEFYKNVRKFYDAREQNENTVKEFCDYLVQFKKETEEQNVRINALFPNLIARVKETYEKEDHLFEKDDKGARMTRQDLEKTVEEVVQYKTNVQKAETAVAQEVPIQPYHQYNWVDAVTNPVVLGLTGALMVKGASKLLPRPLERPFSRATSFPIDASLYLGKKIAQGTKKASQTAWKGIKKGYNKVTSQYDKLIKLKGEEEK